MGIILFTFLLIPSIFTGFTYGGLTAAEDLFSATGFDKKEEITINTINKISGPVNPRVIWNYSMHEPAKETLATEKVLYMVSESPDKLIAKDVRDGAIIWSLDLPESEDISLSLTEKNVLVVCGTFVFKAENKIARNHCIGLHDNGTVDPSLFFSVSPGDIEEIVTDAEDGDLVSNTIEDLETDEYEDYDHCFDSCRNFGKTWGMCAQMCDLKF